MNLPHELRTSCLPAILLFAVLGSTDPCPAAENVGKHTAAEYDRHVKKLKKKVAEEAFTIIVAAPFVVIGDDSPDEVERCAKETVQWAVEKLKKAYFRKDPEEILDIWLFKDKESYERHVNRIFHTKPDTPYGYYSHADRALVMNIATGGGTLVHEIVHPFVAANFPQCPAWFNEGLASLYEHCGEQDGQIHGYTNWRLPGLQKTIRKEQLPSFEALCSTTSDEFYGDESGTNYAQARYLCYYLQEQGLLRNFYHRFYAQRKTDPSGYKTLQDVLGRKDMGKFQAEWEAYVLKLRSE
jgi:hypothetical protein